MQTSKTSRWNQTRKPRLLLLKPLLLCKHNQSCSSPWSTTSTSTTATTRTSNLHRSKPQLKLRAPSAVKTRIISHHSLSPLNLHSVCTTPHSPRRRSRLVPSCIRLCSHRRRLTRRCLRHHLSLPQQQQVNGTTTHHIGSRTRSRDIQQQQQQQQSDPPIPPPLLEQAAVLDQQPDQNEQEPEEREEEEEERAERPPNGSSEPPLEHQLSIDLEHPGSDTVLQQRKLMRDIRKQQRKEEYSKKLLAAAAAAATTSSASHRTPTRANKKQSNGTNHKWA